MPKKSASEKKVPKKTKTKTPLTKYQLKMAATFASIDSKFDTLIAAIHRMNARLEEDLLRNQPIYDQICQRQKEIEKRRDDQI